MNLKVRYWDKESTLFYTLYFLIIIVVYFSPSIALTRVFFLLLLPFIYFSKKDYFWIALLFIILDAPGHLFAGGAAEDIRRIPNYPITSGQSIHFFDLLILTYLTKSYFSKISKISRFVFKNQIKIFIGLIAFYFIYTITSYSYDLISIIKLIMPWFLVFIIKRFMNNEESFHNFNKLIFPVIILAFLSQIFSFFEGQHLVNFMRGGDEEFLFKEKLSKQITDQSETAARNLYSLFIIFYSLTVSFIYLSRKNTVFSRRYLIFITSLSVLTSVLTGTRGLLFAIVVIILTSLFLGGRFKKGLSQYLGIAIMFVILLFIVSLISPAINRQIELVLLRYETILNFARGDITAGGTVQRYTYRVPMIMEWINISPLFGYGYSLTFFENADNDIGFHSLILNVGYFGAFILYSLFIGVIVKIYILARSPFYISHYQKSGLIFIAGLFGLMAYHMTTNVAYGLTPSANGILHERYMIYGLFLVFFNITYLKSAGLHSQIRSRASAGSIIE